jgi:hypothetical protein
LNEAARLFFLQARVAASQQSNGTGNEGRAAGKGALQANFRAHLSKKSDAYLAIEPWFGRLASLADTKVSKGAQRSRRIGNALPADIAA